MVVVLVDGVGPCLLDLSRELVVEPEVGVELAPQRDVLRRARYVEYVLE